MRHIWAFGFLTIATLVGLTACGGDGQTLREPSEDQTTTTRPVSTSALPQDVGARYDLTLSSPDFEPAGEVPATALCEGGSTMPKLTWTDVPPRASELAISLADYTNFDEPLLIYLVAGIDPNERSFDIDRLPEGAIETLNDWGVQGFGSPCLESLSDEQNVVRDLQFRLHAMNSKTRDVEPGGHGRDSWSEVQRRSSESAGLLMRYIPTVSDSELDSDPLPDGAEEGDISATVTTVADGLGESLTEAAAERPDATVDVSNEE